jgi:sucrose-6-phosphate hydrolase SacC (GH32 family)
MMYDPTRDEYHLMYQWHPNHIDWGMSFYKGHSPWQQVSVPCVTPVVAKRYSNCCPGTAVSTIANFCQAISHMGTISLFVRLHPGC